jgi:acetyl-CoA carboxylase biotin carboxylase subunit
MNRSPGKILVANRGEIAVRILRACEEMGYRTVTVYSEADRKSLHVRYADEAYCIGPPPSQESYLRIEKIIDVARKSGADGIHPGYGFLAENAEMAEACVDSGLVWIGPSSSVIRSMGDKIFARHSVRKVGVPVIPGAEGKIDDIDSAVETARKITYPVLIKAAAGGGGKGMRIVHEERELRDAVKRASSEARSAFGDETVYIEKYLEKPRHIEFQILADNYGTMVHLGERECSIQRRHQKMIEESPSPIIDGKTREDMGKNAIKAAGSVGYDNVGTVEFLLDGTGNYYFLEMNTRLQVEHPVTEMVTGVDIVKEQIQIAFGTRLSIAQKDIRLNGSSIECRISAEDPANNFFPSSGNIQGLIDPGGPGIRVDSGIYEGYDVSLFYDPLISKVIVWGKDRREAIRRMIRALMEYRILGIKTTIPFHERIMQNEHFLAGDFDTNFIESVFTAEEMQREKFSRMEAAIVTAIVAHGERKRSRLAIEPAEGDGRNMWKWGGRSWRY